MKTTEEHRIKVREIADLAFANAVNSMDIKKLIDAKPKDWDENIKKKFIIKVHEGFKKSQDLLVQEILENQEILRQKKEALKESRRNREADKAEKLSIEIDVLKQRISTFSHIADGIAWQLISGEIHIARRFHIGEDSSKFLDSSNIEHAKRVVDEINKSPLDFALISDLTSFVQIGDVLIRHNHLIGIMELKEGKVNDQIKDFFDDLKKNNTAITDDLINNKFDKKTAKQARRMQRQILRAERATEVMNSDTGIDPVSGTSIKVSTPTIQPEGYQEEFMKLNKTLETKIWAYTVIENCLHIGMYRDEGVAMAGFAIENILKKDTENFIVVDWLSITNNLSQPIFAKPFPPDFIVDVLTGKIKIILGINLDNLIEFFNILGIKTRWLTRKETAKAKQKEVRKGMVVVNNRAISMDLPNLGGEAIMSGGIISKILYDNILPSNIALSLLSIQPEKE